MIVTLMSAAMLVASPADAAAMAADLPAKSISQNSTGWFDSLSRRNNMCGKNGKRGEKLATLYDAITEAETGEDALEAASDFVAYRDSSNIVESCWDTVRSRAGLARKTDKMIDAIAELA